MTVSLATLIVPSKIVSIDFPGMEGFVVDLCYLARDEMVKLRKRCTTTKFNKLTHAPEEILDDEKFVKTYCSAVVKGWQGFKLKYVEEFLLVDLSGQDPDNELSFTEDNLILLMKNAPAFERWVQDEVSNLENFTKNK
jgi:hypothetical protein